MEAKAIIHWAVVPMNNNTTTTNNNNNIFITAIKLKLYLWLTATPINQTSATDRQIAVRRDNVISIMLRPV